MSIAIAVAIVAGSAMGLVIAAVVQALLVDEARAWLPHITRSLIRSSARRLPAKQRDRYREEWLAEVANWNDRPISALAKAASIRLHARSVRYSLTDPETDRVPVVQRVMACVLILGTAPLLALIAIAVRVGSPGPILWRTYRVGPDGRVVPNAVTFRTVALYRDAEDPTIMRTTPTKLGTLLTTTDLQYLPCILEAASGRQRLAPILMSLARRG